MKITTYQVASTNYSFELDHIYKRCYTLKEALELAHKLTTKAHPSYAVKLDKERNPIWNTIVYAYAT